MVGLFQLDDELGILHRLYGLDGVDVDDELPVGTVKPGGVQQVM